MKRPRGTTPAMFDSYIRALFHAGIDPDRIVQTMTVGKGVAASAGTHDKQGEITAENGVKIPFGVAIDIHVHDLSDTQIEKMLLELAKQGYVGWYRHTGSFSGGKSHVHIVYCGHYIVADILHDQIIDYLNNRTGLKGHATETFFTAPTSVDKPLAQMYARSNPNRRKRIPQELLA